MEHITSVQPRILKNKRLKSSVLQVSRLPLGTIFIRVGTVHCPNTC